MSIPRDLNRYYKKHEDAIPDILRIHRFVNRMLGYDENKGAITIDMRDFRRRQSHISAYYHRDTKHITINLKVCIKLNNKKYSNILSTVYTIIHEKMHSLRTVTGSDADIIAQKEAIELDCHARSRLFFYEHIHDISVEFDIDTKSLKTYARCHMFSVIERYLMMRENDDKFVNRLSYLDNCIDRIFLDYDHFATHCVNGVNFDNDINH